MPFIEVNGANLYYETYGSDRPGCAPIVLIHGSTGTGRSNWSVVAPLLAREYRVIVPDCRGHGQSSNPNRTYTFKEMAADTSGLIRALGYTRAHIIGHSNGGNVVLVTLLEHPDVVQACLPQAANAYVSPDLVEKEPSIFDPDRVAREAPSWMNEMIALHGSTHGVDYWRDLLRLTVQEIISEPNYTPDDLAAVRRPTLVIQGANDRVNAPARHAQFIAQHIPDAESWIPAGVGHNVHDEMLFDWVKRVLDFLSRRGDDANDALYRLRRARYSNERETIFRVRVSSLSEKGGGGEEGTGREGVALEGEVLTSEQHRAALDVLAVNPAEDRVRVLLAEDTPWALVNRSVADVRREPSGFAELMTEALVGESARILEEREGWVQARLDRDGYLGWMRANSLYRCSQADVMAYRASADMVVVAELAQAYLTPNLSSKLRGEAAHPSPTRTGDEAGLPPSPSRRGDGGEVGNGGEVGKLPFGVALPVVERKNSFVALRLPNGRVWWVAQNDLMPIAERPEPDAAGIATALSLFRRSVGVPYLWGGRTPFGFDCSGLAQTLWSFVGVQIPRDADQQFRAGAPVEDTPQPGDLLFFGEPEDGRAGFRYAHITHVAISLGGDEMIHANGTDWGIAYNSLDPASPMYRAWLKEHLVGVRRFSSL
jgi:pimeloyl-ACP methyl ester carboxylesterase/cell wall-associated NlpC family hydrolase